MSSWKGIKARNKVDGRTGVIASDYEGFGHRVLTIKTDCGEAVVELSSIGKDSGDIGWQWLCENFSEGPHWLMLGDHNPYEPAQPA